MLINGRCLQPKIMKMVVGEKIEADRFAAARRKSDSASLEGEGVFVALVLITFDYQEFFCNYEERITRRAPRHLFHLASAGTLVFTVRPSSCCWNQASAGDARHFFAPWRSGNSRPLLPCTTTRLVRHGSSMRSPTGTIPQILAINEAKACRSCRDNFSAKCGFTVLAIVYWTISNITH